MNRGKVYVPQEPMRKNPDGSWSSKGYNLAAAADYGDICVIWKPDATIMTRASAEESAVLIAAQYNEDEDYVVALGSPSLIALLGWAIGAEGKQLRILEWDRRMGRYYPTLTGPAHIAERNDR